MHTSVEAYDAGADKWTVLAAHLPCERKYHTACELNGNNLLCPFLRFLQQALHHILASGSCLCGVYRKVACSMELGPCRPGVCCGRHD